MKQQAGLNGAAEVGRRDFCGAAAWTGATFAALVEASAQESPSQVETSETRPHVVRRSEGVICTTP